MTDVDRALDALNHCDAGCGRDDWVKLAMAAKAAGISVEDFNTWSAAGSNYGGERDVQSVWNSIRRTDGVSEKTLFKHAMDGGWKPPTDEKVVKKKTVPPATEVWNRCYPAKDDHPYIASKQGRAAGIKMVPHDSRLRIAGQDVAGWLALPVMELDGATMHSLQFIPAPGAGKKLNYPAPMCDGAFVVGSLTLGCTAYVVEGIGQAWACNAATGQPAVVAFGWGRVGSIAASLKKRDPSINLVIVPDVGKEADAEKIAARLPAALVAMPAGWGQNSDVNDLMQRDGLPALQGLLTKLQRPAPTPRDGVMLTRGSDLKPEPVQWLWPDWLALGKLHILAGAAGVGKTTVALALEATVTIGGRWPDGSRSDPGNVLFWSGEDDAADTLLPRLIAAGADRERCYFISGTRIDGEAQPFDPARDLGDLLAAVEQIGGVKLLIVDPVVSAVTGDSHKNTEVRRGLQPLVDLAAACQCAVLGITHFAKGGQGQDPTQRVVGSVAFSAVARVVLVAAKVKGESGEDARILARSKSNIGPDDGGFEYHLEQVEALPGIPASRIAWGKAVEGTARELLTDPDDDQGDDADDACELLRAELREASWTGADIAGQPLKAAGFTKKQIWAASRKLGVIRKKGAMKEGWYWRLPGGPNAAFSIGAPEDSTEDSEGSSFRNVESSEPSQPLESSAEEVL